MEGNSRAVLTSSPIRKKLLFLLLLIFLPAFGIILASGLKQRQDEIVKARNNALLLAQSLAAQQEQIATSNKVLLTTLAQLPAVQHLDAKACNKLLAELKQRFPLQSNMGVTTPEGKMFAASKPFKAGSINLSDRKHWRDAVATGGFATGEYQTARVSARPSLNYAYPVLNANGKLVAVVVSSFSLDAYGHLVSQAHVPPGYSVTIADWKGMRLFRSPAHPDTAVGVPIASRSMEAMTSSDTESGFFERKSQDGLDRVYGFKRLRLGENSPYIYMLVGAPRNELLAQANKQMFLNLSMLGISALAALCLAWAFGEYVFLHPINRLLRATQQLGKGEMNIRTGLHHSTDELGQLAKSFDDMAALLEMRSSERQSAEEALSKVNTELELRVQERTAELSALNEALRLEVVERKRAELELTESRRRLQAAMDAAKLGVWARDLDTGELICDARTKAIIGIEPDDPITYAQLLNRLVVEDREAFNQLCDGRSEEQNGNINVEYRIQSQDRGIRWVHVRGSVMRDGSGAPKRVIGVLMDITERKQAEQEMRSLEEQFRHSQKMEAVGRLAGGIAHDFNNLLQVINGHSELIADGAGPDNPVTRQANAIHQAGQRAAQLTSHLLAFSRHQIAEPKVFEMDQAVTGFEKIVRRVVPEDIELRTRLNAGRACVKIAPVQLEQVIMNLVVNARDAMASGGRLTIATTRERFEAPTSKKGGDLSAGDYVVLSVTDSGQGIDPALRERVFEPFFTTKPLGKGTGLGLSTVYGILRQNGGGVHLHSKTGKGSIFKVYLPLCREAVREKALAILAPPPVGLETVLLVEDEGAVRTLIQEHLKELGYRVLDASNGVQALELARQHIAEIDIVVTDAIMPKLGGYELSAQLRLLQPEIKILLMTGYSDAAVCDQARAAGLRLLSKPFSRRTLAGILREMLDSHLSAQAAAAETLLAEKVMPQPA